MFILNFWNSNPPVTAFPCPVEGQRELGQQEAFPKIPFVHISHCCGKPNFSNVIKGISYCSTHPKTAGVSILSSYSPTLCTFKYA